MFQKLAFCTGSAQETEEADHKIVDTVAAIANERGVSRAQVALAWLLHKPAVTAPIVDLSLSDDEQHRLEEHYLPQEPEGF